MLWEAYQQTKIAGAERKADSAKSKVDRYTQNIDDLSRHLDRLSLACQAMWELLRDHSNLEEGDIENKILEIDGRDGSVDGKMSTSQLDCPSCGKRTNSKRINCVMCGAPIQRSHKFEG